MFQFGLGTTVAMSRLRPPPSWLPEPGQGWTRLVFWILTVALVLAGLQSPALGHGSQPLAQRVDGPIDPPSTKNSATPVDSVGAASSTSMVTRDTLSVRNGSLFSGNVQFPQISLTWGVAFVPSVGELYLSSQCVVYLVNPSTLSILRVLPGIEGCGLAYVPSTGYLYLSGPSRVLILDPYNNTIVGNIKAPDAGQTTSGLFVYDPYANALLVGQLFNSTANVVGLAQGRVIANISVGYNTDQGAYDPINRDVYIAGYENDTLEIVNSSTWRVTYQGLPIPLSGFLYGITVDVQTGNIFATDDFYCPGCYGFAYLVEFSWTNGSVLTYSGLGAWPTGLAYDSDSNDLYVGDSIANKIYVVNPSNLTVLDSISADVTSYAVVGAWFLSYVPELETIYTATSWSASLLAVSGTSLRTYGSLGGLTEPVPEAWDAACDCLVVGDYIEDQLYFINGTTYALEQTVPLSGAPRSIVYDTGTHRLWVSLGGLFGSLGIDVLDGSNGTLVRTLSPGAWPSSITYDSKDKRMYVPYFSDNVVDVYGSSNLTLFQRVPVGPQEASPGSSQLAWDPSNDRLYLTDWEADNITVIDGANGTVVGNITGVPGPDSIVYDGTVGEIYSADENAANITVIDPAIDSVVGNLSYAYGASLLPQSDSPLLFATNDSGTIAEFNLTNGSVTHIAAGTATNGLAWLPSGTLAATDLGGAVYFVARVPSTALTTPSLSISPSLVANGTSVQLRAEEQGGSGELTYTYSGLPPGCTSIDAANWTCTPKAIGTYFVNVTVSESGGEYKTGSAVLWVTPTYPVTIQESGLPAGTEWWVNLTGGPAYASFSSSIMFSEWNGTFSFAAASANRTFAPAEGTGSFSVDGDGVTVSVEFSPEEYLVTFTEDGLPFGTVWGIDIAGTVELTSAAALSFLLTNGTYPYSVVDLPGWSEEGLAHSGWFQVSGSATAEPTLRFSRVVYSVTVVESGLPSGTAWWFNLTDGQSYLSISANVTFSDPNASYSYVLGSSVKTFAGQGSEFQINGSPVVLGVRFGIVRFSVAFSESGLPAGTPWSATLNGVTESSQSAFVNFSESNGSYNFQVPPVGSYNVSNDSGTIRVEGANIGVVEEFSIPPPPRSTPPPSANGSRQEAYGTVELVAGVLVVGVAVTALVLYRRMRPPKTPSSQSSGRS